MCVFKVKFINKLQNNLYRNYNLGQKFVDKLMFFYGMFYSWFFAISRSSHPKMFLGRGVLEICGKFTGDHPCRSVISMNLQSNFIEITLRHVRSPVSLLHIFRAPFLKRTSGWLICISYGKQLECSLKVVNR